LASKYFPKRSRSRQREETADVSARLFTALAGTDEGGRAVPRVLAAVFLWVQRLSSDEAAEFTQDPADAARDITELHVHANLHRVIVEWRATDCILADPELAAQLARPLPEEDYGTVVDPLDVAPMSRLAAACVDTHMSLMT
jgi:hypothetical protein